MEWFKAGGWGMFPILIVGAASIGLGLRTAQHPTAQRLLAMRSLPMLIVVCSLFAFGMNLWAVNFHLSDPAFLAARNIGSAELPFTALMGVTEAGQALTLGGFLATLVIALRWIAEMRQARSAA